MPAPIALQLYSVREAAAKDYAGTVRKVAAMGYVGVETAGFPGTTYQEAAKLFKELGLAVPSGHFPLPVGERKNEVLDMAHTLGCSYIGVGGLPGGHENWKTLDSIKKACDLINEASANVKAHGFPFQYHNHWAEYEKIGDRRVDEIMLELLDPDVMLQLDTYWIKVAGVDPAAVVKSLGKRAPLLHIKDGPGVRGQPHQAVGDGVMDVPSIVKAGGKNTEWLIVELDSCATDIVEAAAKSCAYLMKNKLGRGRSASV